MGSSQPPGPALVAAAADADPVTLLVTAWLSVRRSENTRASYARDIGITPQRRSSRAPSWLAWCQQQGLHPVTGVTGLHVAWYARQLDDAGLAPASAARKLAAISSWYTWLARRGHITASPAAGIARPRPSLRTPPGPALTPDQALALMRTADTAAGPQRARTAALTAVLLFTSARLSEVIGADVADLDTSGRRRVLWVTRANGRRQDLPLPGPAASRIDAYLAARTSQAGDQALFATRTGGRLFPADVRRILRRLATRAGLPADQALHLGPRTISQSFTTLYVQAGTLPGLHSSTWHATSRTTQPPGQARDPDLPLWPRGRPHCRARRPQHAPRHTRPRLSPRKTSCGRPYQQLRPDEALHEPHGAQLVGQAARLGRGSGRVAADPLSHAVLAHVLAVADQDHRGDLDVARRGHLHELVPCGRGAVRQLPGLLQLDDRQDGIRAEQPGRLPGQAQAEVPVVRPRSAGLVQELERHAQGLDRLRLRRYAGRAIRPHGSEYHPGGSLTARCRAAGMRHRVAIVRQKTANHSKRWSTPIMQVSGE
jgi:integrase/recombinase XerD